jgi:hypothetical protein
MAQFPKFHNPLHPESAEQDLIRLIHLEDKREFRVTIEHENGKWKVTTSVPPHQQDFACTGTGESFHAAWNSQNPIPGIERAEK